MGDETTTRRMDDPVNASPDTRGIFPWLKRQPFLFHWVLVVLMAFVIPLLTRSTEKPGEFYPFSNFPMYSRFSPDTYYVFVSDNDDKPIAVGPTFGIAISNVKKAYDRKLTNLKKEIGGKGRKADLPAEKKRVAADEVLHWLTDNAPNPAAVKARAGLRLHEVAIVFKDGRVSKTQSQVGEVRFTAP